MFRDEELIERIKTQVRKEGGKHDLLTYVATAIELFEADAANLGSPEYVIKAPAYYDIYYFRSNITESSLYTTSETPREDSPLEDPNVENTNDDLVEAKCKSYFENPDIYTKTNDGETFRQYIMSAIDAFKHKKQEKKITQVSIHYTLADFYLTALNSYCDKNGIFNLSESQIDLRKDFQFSNGKKRTLRTVLGFLTHQRNISHNAIHTNEFQTVTDRTDGGKVIIGIDKTLLLTVAEAVEPHSELAKCFTKAFFKYCEMEELFGYEEKIARTTVRKDKSLKVESLSYVTRQLACKVYLPKTKPIDEPIIANESKSEILFEDEKKSSSEIVELNADMFTLRSPPNVKRSKPKPRFLDEGKSGSNQMEITSTPKKTVEANLDKHGMPTTNLDDKQIVDQEKATDRDRRALKEELSMASQVITADGQEKPLASEPGTTAPPRSPGRTVIFLIPDLNEDESTWKALIDAWTEEGYEVIAFEPPGTGFDELAKKKKGHVDLYQWQHDFYHKLAALNSDKDIGNIRLVGRGAGGTLLANCMTTIDRTLKVERVTCISPTIHANDPRLLKVFPYKAENSSITPSLEPLKKPKRDFVESFFEFIAFVKSGFKAVRNFEPKEKNWVVLVSPTDQKFSRYNVDLPSFFRSQNKGKLKVEVLPSASFSNHESLTSTEAKSNELTKTQSKQ